MNFIRLIFAAFIVVSAPITSIQAEEIRTCGPCDSSSYGGDGYHRYYRGQEHSEVPTNHITNFNQGECLRMQDRDPWCKNIPKLEKPDSCGPCVSGVARYGVYMYSHRYRDHHLTYVGPKNVRDDGFYTPGKCVEAQDADWRCQ